MLPSLTVPQDKIVVAQNPLKAALRRGERQIGFWLTLQSFNATEMAAHAGFDWLLIDMEHTTTSEADVVAHLRAAVGGKAEPVVRVPWNDAVVMKRLLDAGMRSILVPYVQNAEEARRAVAATRYPPAGIRGFAGHSRATAYGADRDYAHHAHEEIFIAVQAESPAAIAAAGEIAAVDGVDCVFVGPNDLAANMGLLGGAYAPEVQALAGTIVEPVHAAGKAAGILDFRQDGARGWLERGFQLVAVGGDGGLLRTGIDNLVAAFR